MTTILFPSEPFSPRTVDPDFEHERVAAGRAGFATALLDHTRVTQGDVDAAAAGVRARGDVLYRGWMLTAAQYSAAFAALERWDVRLLNTPAEYTFCHYLPNSYDVLAGSTPASAWVPVSSALDFDAILECAAEFGDRPIIVKDYVKSQKHYWTEACFIPNASDRAHVEKVVRRFLELQGPDVNRGLVFREFVPLKIIGHHPRSGMPLAAEFRTFWLRGSLILRHRYWGDLVAFDAEPPRDWLSSLATRISSQMFTMDVALKDDGSWVVVELGDGQVAGLPSAELADEFYSALAKSLS